MPNLTSMLGSNGLASEEDLNVIQAKLDYQYTNNTPISANATLSANGRYGVDFSALRTLTLPATPSTNDKVFIYTTTGDATDSIIARNGSTIMGLAEDMTLDSNILSLEMIYSGTTWRILA